MSLVIIPSPWATRRPSVQVSAPHGVTEYIKATMEFANWAFMTEEARAAAQQGRMAVTAALKATECTKVICDYALTSKLPDVVTEASDHSTGTASAVPALRASNGSAAAPRFTNSSAQLLTPAPQTREPLVATGTSSYGDPPTGWTTSKHRGPQQLSVDMSRQFRQQENMSPSVGATINDAANHLSSCSLEQRDGCKNYASEEHSKPQKSTVGGNTDASTASPGHAPEILDDGVIRSHLNGADLLIPYANRF